MWSLILTVNQAMACNLQIFIVCGAKWKYLLLLLLLLLLSFFFFFFFNFIINPIFFSCSLIPINEYSSFFFFFFNFILLSVYSPTFYIFDPLPLLLALTLPLSLPTVYWPFQHGMNQNVRSGTHFLICLEPTLFLVRNLVAFFNKIYELGLDKR